MKIKSYLSYNTPYSMRTRISQIRSLFSTSKIEKGRHCYIDKSAEIIGKDSVKFGDNVCIGMNCNININGSRDDGVKRLIIGNNSYIGRETFISTGKLISIGEFFFGGPHCSIIGVNHVFSNPIFSYLLGECTLDKEIIIEDNVWLGDNVSLIGNVKIGRGSIIGAKTLVTKDIPPFSIAIGNPCKIYKRFDFTKNEWVSPEQLSADNKIPSLEEYKELLHKNNPQIIDMPIVALTNRYGGF